MMWDAAKRWRWAILIAGLLVAGLAFAFWPEATPVDVGKVTRGGMEVGVTDDGVTRAEEHYVVSSPVTGYLARIELEAGDIVRRGGLITTITGRPSAPLDPRSREEVRNALDAARATEKGAAATLAQTRRDLARAEELAGRGFLPRARLEAERARVANEAASLQRARADVRRIEATLAQPSRPGSGARADVRAPASGSILSVLNESEGVITEGTELVTIGDASRIEVVVDLLSREAVRVKPGNPVKITEWGGPTPLLGHVKRVEPFGRLKVSALGIEEQRVNVIIGFDEASASSAVRLGQGYQIDATIIFWNGENVLRVPIGALSRGQGGDWNAFVVERSRARQRRLKIGHLNDEFGEVLVGLAEGEAVVLNPGNALKDGERVVSR